MPTVPRGVILIWPDTNASIPSGWVRETSLDEKFPKGAPNLTNPNVTGGNAEHHHTSPNHTHNVNSHVHNGSVSTSSGDDESDGEDVTGASERNHRHTYTTDSMSDGNLVLSVTYQDVVALPPYHDVIFIKPGTLPAQLDESIIALFDDSTIPTDWDVCDGDNSTPDLDAKFLRGADAGEDAGTTGGALTHQHSVDHNHGAIVHSHQASAPSVSTADREIKDRQPYPGGGPVYDSSHKHVVYLNNASQTPSTYSGNAGSAETVQPLHKLLRAIQNNTGGFSKPKGIIGLWLGALNTIPAGWFLCNGQNGTPDMRDYFLKITDDGAEVGDTAGANTHSHAASNSHTHTAPSSHTHSGYSSAGTPETTYSTTNRSGYASKPHSHGSLASCDAQTTTWTNSTIQADSSNNEPPYRTVAFIMFKYEVQGGAAVLGGILIN